MSGSEFERENIVAEALSATAASKPADTLLEDSPREHNWRPPAEGLYDLAHGEGFLRRRLHRQHQGQEVASDRLRRDQHSLQPRTSRRGRRRSARRRRRRHSGADPARLLRAQGRRDRLQAAGARPLRDRRAVHAEGDGVAKGDPEHHRRTDQGRRPACCSAGATCRPTTLRSAKPSSRPSPTTCRCSSAATARRRPRTSSSAGSTSCASRSRRRSISAATAGWPAITRSRCRAAP